MDVAIKMTPDEVEKFKEIKEIVQKGKELEKQYLLLHIAFWDAIKLKHNLSGLFEIDEANLTVNEYGEAVNEQKAE